MSGSVEIVLWLQEYKLQALEAQLARDGCSTEKLLQDMLDDLYPHCLAKSFALIAFSSPCGSR